MVFCETPSKGCAACRAKKKKCDGVRPACSLCVRTNRKCPGYRDRLDLGFRDEKHHILHRIRRQKGIDDEETQQPSKTPTTTTTTTTTIHSHAPSPALSTALSLPPVKDQARCFFFHHYVFTDLAAPYSIFTSLPTICSRGADGNNNTDAISAVIEAIGAAGIANIRSDARFMRVAHERHASAIHHTRCLLANGDQQHQQDQAGLAVMLLALYENIKCSTPESMRSWSKHVRGATAILALQAHNSLHDDASLQLFLYLRQQIIIDCLQRTVAVPRFILQISQNMNRLIDNTKTLWSHSLEEISIKLCDLRCAIRLNTITTEEAVCEALNLDKALVDWVSNMPDEYSYSTLHDFESPDDVFFGCYHEYNHPRAMALWNHYRCLRLITHEVLMAQLSSSTSSSTAVAGHESQFQSSKQILNKMVADICGSVPLYIGYKSGGGKYWTHGMMGILFLWPLYICATHAYSPPSVRSWVISQLDKIGTRMGIKLATSLAGLLNVIEEVTVWEKMDGREDEVSEATTEDEEVRYEDW